MHEATTNMVLFQESVTMMVNKDYVLFYIPGKDGKKVHTPYFRHARFQGDAYVPEWLKERHNRYIEENPQSGRLLFTSIKITKSSRDFVPAIILNWER